MKQYKRKSRERQKVFGSDVLNLSQLKQNERFYFAADKLKTVYQVLRPDTYIQYGFKKKIVVCRDDHNGEYRFDANRVVVFLRKDANGSWIEQRNKTIIKEIQFN